MYSSYSLPSKTMPPMPPQYRSPIFFDPTPSNSLTRIHTLMVIYFGRAL